VFHDLDPQEIKNAGVTMTYDEHGHPELGKISKAVLFNDILDKEFKKIGLKIKTRPVEIGYDVRCQDPIGYDLTYCTELAMGAYELFAKGETGCMVYVDAEGEAHPLYLKDLQNAEGKIPPRRVNIDGGTAQNYFSHICHYITPADYEAAKKYVPNPEDYDFKKILGW
jgi:6-phosphofructokinase 1